MTELRTILRNADPYSLILGDELCRGTETDSAIGLTVASLEEFLGRSISFIFSTHLHNIVDMSEIKKLTSSNENKGRKIRIAHLETYNDSQTGNLVYIRKLQDGPGSKSYGLEVAKWLGLDSNFIRRAELIRKSISNIPTEFLSTKTSKYNSKIYVDQCQLCSSKIQLHTHHIQAQQYADENGFVGTYHKNSTFNLMVLCQDCHTKIHKLQDQGLAFDQIFSQLAISAKPNTQRQSDLLFESVNDRSRENLSINRVMLS